MVADALDRAAIRHAVITARPDVVVHEMTALSGRVDLRRFDRTFATTNRLRIEGTDHLLAAAQEAGVRRFLAQSFCGWPYAREGGPVKGEDDPLDPAPPAGLRAALEAIRHVERSVTNAPGIDGIVLRYGAFYGPETGVFDGPTIEELRRRRVPLIGDGQGWWSFVHVDDAAVATALAIGRGAPGTYNIVDDAPSPAAEWLPALAAMLGAKPPRRVPRLLARLIAGAPVVTLMTESRAGCNDKAARELCWRPAHASWRQGFAEVLAQRG